MDSVISFDRGETPSGLIGKSISSILEIKSIALPYYADLVLHLLKSQRPEYIKYFTPFSNSINEIEEKLTSARRDIYLGIFTETSLIGLAMLRGWDDDHKIPRIGVMVDERYAHRGFSSAAVHILFGICREMKCHEIDAKIYHGNLASSAFFGKHGFKSEEVHDTYSLVKKKIW